MGVTGKRVEKFGIGGRTHTEAYLLPTASRGAWALMNPAQVDRGRRKKTFGEKNGYQHGGNAHLL